MWTLASHANSSAPSCCVIELRIFASLRMQRVNSIIIPKDYSWPLLTFLSIARDTTDNALKACIIESRSHWSLQFFPGLYNNEAAYTPQNVAKITSSCNSRNLNSPLIWKNWVENRGSKFRQICELILRFFTNRTVRYTTNIPRPWF